MASSSSTEERLRYELENQRIVHKGITEYASQLQARLVATTRQLREAHCRSRESVVAEGGVDNGSSSRSRDLLSVLSEQTTLIRSLEAHVEAARAQQFKEREVFAQTLAGVEREGRNARNVSAADRLGRFVDKWSAHNLELRDSLAAHETATKALRAELRAEREGRAALSKEVLQTKARALKVETEAAAAINQHIRRTKFLNAQLARLSSPGLDGDVGGVAAAHARRLEAGKVLVDQVVELQAELERLRGMQGRSGAVVRIVHDGRPIALVAP